MRIVYFTIGIIATGLGTVGIFLPLLPTTPFLLLAAFCFMRSSSRLHHWLMHHKVLGRFIKDYVEHKAITKKTKRTALLFLWASLGLSIVLVPLLHVKLLLLVIGTGVTVHLNLLKTMTPSAPQSDQSSEASLAPPDPKNNL